MLKQTSHDDGARVGSRCAIGGQSRRVTLLRPDANEAHITPADLTSSSPPAEGFETEPPSPLREGRRRMSGALLDGGQAAELLNVPKSWVMGEARADRIPHIRFGRYVRFDANDLELWWDARKQGPVRRPATPAKTTL